MKKVMLSAVQPTSQMTLGNYLGALKNWVKLQSQYDCIFFAVDLHALTADKPDPKVMRENTYSALATYIACGISPDEATLFVQSHVHEHARLCWYLNCFAHMGELNRMTQYKDKSSKQGVSIGVGLFTYPVLMAADILLYRTHLVPVGEDQKQHVELARDLAIRVNHHFDEEIFVVPEPYIAKVGARIMSLQNPTAKMSKSDQDPHATVFLSDSKDQILKKLKRAVTDSGTEIAFDEEAKPGVSNLLGIQSAITGKSVKDLVAGYTGKQYGHLKVETAEMVAAELGPIRDQVAEILKDRDYLEKILARGAHQARERAAPLIEKIESKLGLVPLAKFG